MIHAMGGDFGTNGSELEIGRSGGNGRGGVERRVRLVRIREEEVPGRYLGQGAIMLLGADARDEIEAADWRRSGNEVYSKR